MCDSELGVIYSILSVWPTPAPHLRPTPSIFLRNWPALGWGWKPGSSYILSIFFTLSASARFSARCFLSGQVALSEWSHQKWNKQTSLVGGVNGRPCWLTLWTDWLWNGRIKFTRLNLVEQRWNQRRLTAGEQEVMDVNSRRWWTWTHPTVISKPS